MPVKKRPSRRQPNLAQPAPPSSLPQFVVGLAEGSPGARCRRCRRQLEPVSAPRAFEHALPLCDLCSLEHAPPVINRFLIAEAGERWRRSRRPEHLERLASAEQIRKGLNKELSASEAESLVWVLLQLYPQTVEVLAEVVGVEKLAQILEAGERWAEGETEESVLATLEAVVRLSPVEGVRAHEVWVGVEGLPLAEACAQLRAILPKFRKPALYHRLAEESWAQLREAPRRTWELAELAVVALEVLDAELFSPEWLADLGADAWARLGNARRVACELHAADAALEKALACYERGSRQWRRKAEILDFLGSLRRDQRRFDEALACLEEALEIYRLYRDHGRVAKVMNEQATVLIDACEPTRAAAVLKQAVALIDRESEPRLLLASYHNLVLCLCDSKSYTEAERLLPFAEACQETVGERMDRAKLTWVRGKIVLGLQRYGDAREHFVAAYEEFGGLGDACSAAAVALDLASCQLAQGKKKAALELVQEIVPIFESRSIDREALATLEMFRHNLALDQLTQELIEELKAVFKRFRCDFEPCRTE